MDPHGPWSSTGMESSGASTWSAGNILSSMCGTLLSLERRRQSWMKILVAVSRYFAFWICTNDLSPGGYLSKKLDLSPKNDANTEKLNAQMSSDKFFCWKKLVFVHFYNIRKNINMRTQKTCAYLQNILSEVTVSGFLKRGKSIVVTHTCELRGFLPFWPLPGLFYINVLPPFLLHLQEDIVKGTTNH